MFSRWKELKRHLVSHLPQWIYCPFPGCQWRGRRVYQFRNHWRYQHLKHPGDTPTQSQFAIYDPFVFVDLIQWHHFPRGGGSNRTRSCSCEGRSTPKLSFSTNSWGHRSNRARQRFRTNVLYCCSIYAHPSQYMVGLTTSKAHNPMRDCSTV
ncbi:hypothetical protein BJY52DRAFT_1294184 [Lactarius psammicola]|nr:hypothetical protein BJY52DRAFT_1294184 [Lactarius psammicola]